MAFPSLPRVVNSTHNFGKPLATWLILAAIMGQQAYAQLAEPLDLEQESVRLAAIWKRQWHEIASASIKAEYYHDRAGRRSPDTIKALVTALEQHGVDIGR